MARKRAENREGSLGFPGFVKPVFTKDSKPLGRRKRSLGHLGSVTPYSPKEVNNQSHIFLPAFLDLSTTIIVELSKLHWKPMFNQLKDVMCVVKYPVLQYFLNFRKKNMARSKIGRISVKYPNELFLTTTCTVHEYVFEKCNADLEDEKDFIDDHREEFTDFVQSILGFQECDEEDVETWMLCEAEECGFQMLNDETRF
ncbi:uncharacterized protein TNCV_3707551 [Trichonephila clavipes]|nr:uncharacterized protein TNCV_3707551 [Trichonephila clavipes]